MSNAISNSRDPDDFFAETRMSFGDHIEDLRTHLLRAIYGFLIAMIAGFFIGPYALDFIKAPVERELMNAYRRRIERSRKDLQDADSKVAVMNEPKVMELSLNMQVLRKSLGIAPPAEGEPEWVPVPVQIRPVELTLITGDATHTVLLQQSELKVMGATEGLLVYLKVSLYCGLVLSGPWIFYQLWMFVAAGLYPQEKRLVHVSMPLSIGLFLAGVALCQFIVIPAALAYLMSINEWLGVGEELRLNEWLSFAIWTPLVFGIAFQAPVVMVALQRIGITTVEFYRKQRRMAYFLLAVLSIPLAATPDAFGMLSIAIPLWILYEFGIWLCRFSPPTAADEMGVEESDELVGV
jgi:sec-independent protein translocase protein TatC